MTMYLGMEIPMSFSPLSTGAGVGPKEATNMGLLAASPFTKAIQASSDSNTFSFSPTSHEMVVAWVDGLAIHDLVLPLGIGQVLVAPGGRPRP